MIELSLWRCRIGLFVPALHRCAVRLAPVVVGGDGGGCGRPCLLPVCVLVIAAMLLIGGNVESNPGPLGKHSELEHCFEQIHIP